MFDLLEKVDLLKHLSFRKVILHIGLLYGLNRNILSSQLVDAQGDLTEGTLPYKFNKFVIFEGRRGKLIVLLYVLLYELYQSISLLKNGFINFGS